jgi:tight adherence protein B
LTIGALAYFMSREAIVAGIFVFGGWFVPKVWLGRRQAARVKAFNDQLADTIGLLSNSLRSGMSLVQSMEMISREAEPPVSEEFQRVVREIGLGIGPQQALLHLVGRVASEDLPAPFVNGSSSTARSARCRRKAGCLATSCPGCPSPSAGS